MQTAVRVTLGPHGETKAIQHLRCLLACWCKSCRLPLVSSWGVQTTQRRLNPLTAKWAERDRNTGGVSGAVLLSDFYFFLFDLNSLHSHQWKKQWATWSTRGPSPWQCHVIRLCSFLTHPSIREFHTGDINIWMSRLQVSSPSFEFCLWFRCSTICVLFTLIK